MWNRIILIGTLVVIVGCILPLFAEQGDPNTSQAEPNDSRMTLIKKTPLETRVKRLERKVKELEKDIKIALRDNRQHIANMEALNREVEIIKSKGTSPGSAYKPYRAYRPKRTRRGGTIDEEGNVSTYTYETDSRKHRTTVKRK